MGSNAKGAAAKDRKPPGRNGFVYKPQYGIIVHCPDEEAQAKAYARLSGMGYKLKVVCV